MASFQPCVMMPLATLLMPDLDELTRAIEKLLEWIRRQLEASGELTPKDKANLREALSHLVVAVNETKLFINDGSAGEPPAPANNTLIAGLWHRASRALLQVDPDFSRKLELKQEVWLYPQEWTTRRIKTSQVAISDVEENLRKLMKIAYD